MRHRLRVRPLEKPTADDGDDAAVSGPGSTAPRDGPDRPNGKSSTHRAWVARGAHEPSAGGRARLRGSVRSSKRGVLRERNERGRRRWTKRGHFFPEAVLRQARRSVTPLGLPGGNDRCRREEALLFVGMGSTSYMEGPPEGASRDSRGAFRRFLRCGGCGRAARARHERLRSHGGLLRAPGEAPPRRGRRARCGGDRARRRSTRAIPATRATRPPAPAPGGRSRLLRPRSMPR